MLTLRAMREGTDSGTRIVLTLSGGKLPPQFQDGRIFFELLDDEITDLTTLDGFASGIIHFLMESRQDLHIEGRISRTYLRNLTEYQRYWSLIRPDRCSAIRITADEIVADCGDTRDLPALASYSGGIDSSFTVLRHSLKLCGMDTIPPQAVVTVHGLDVTLANQAGFTALLERLRPVIDELGLKRYVVRTNLKELALQDWLDSHCAQLVACLHTVSHRHSAALVANDGYAQFPLFDYAGNPVTVPLLTTSRLKVLLDGGHHGRTDKVRLLAQYPTILRSLKFCWEGTEVDRNCGHCPKCLLTYMNFRAVGVEEPDCFDTPIRPELVDTFAIRSTAAFVLGFEALQHLWKMPNASDVTARFSAPILRFDEESMQQYSAQSGAGHDENLSSDSRPGLRKFLDMIIGTGHVSSR